MNRLVLFHQEEGKAPRIRGPFLAAGQHRHNLGAAISDEALDAIDTPYARLFVIGSAGLHRPQVGAGVRLGEHHSACHLAPREAGQDAGLHLLVAELADR